MQPTEQRDPAAMAPPADLVRSAFRELHGTRLHGFALLLTLGDRPRAARLAADALRAAEADLGSHRHPERAAAWLRAHVLGAAGRRSGRDLPVDRRATLEELGVNGPARAGLTALSTRERAAVIAASIERLEPLDVATIVGRDGGRLESLLRRARTRYLEAAAVVPPDSAFPRGPITQRVRASATRAFT